MGSAFVSAIGAGRGLLDRRTTPSSWAEPGAARAAAWSAILNDTDDIRSLCTLDWAARSVLNTVGIKNAQRIGRLARPRSLRHQGVRLGGIERCPRSSATSAPTDLRSADDARWLRGHATTYTERSWSGPRRGDIASGPGWPSHRYRSSTDNELHSYRYSTDLTGVGRFSRRSRRCPGHGSRSGGGARRQTGERIRLPPRQGRAAGRQVRAMKF